VATRVARDLDPEFLVPQLILASGSESRLGLLRAAGIDVHPVPPRIDERDLEKSLGVVAPVELALALAQAKADEVAARQRGFILAADQIVVDGGEVIGKPVDDRDHFARLRSLAGRPHELITAWVLLAPGGARRSGVERSRLWLRDDLTDSELRAYVASGQGSGCAGGYAVEGHAAWLIERVDGDLFNVIGLPVLAVVGALRELGWRYPQASP